MSFQSYEKMWKAYVDVFTAYLLTDETVGTADDTSVAGQRLFQLCREAGSLRTVICFAHPTRYIGYNYTMGQVPAPSLIARHCERALSARRLCEPAAFYSA